MWKLEIPDFLLSIVGDLVIVKTLIYLHELFELVGCCIKSSRG